MKAIFDHAEADASNIKTFFFKPERPMEYTAGQYTELTLPHDTPDDRGIKRWFTLSSAPGHDLVSITTKYAGDDKSSTFKKALFRLQPGAEVQLAAAMGDFVLPKDTTIPLLFVAGGIGLTPFHSMAAWLSAQHEARQITFLYAVRTESEIVFQDTFRQAGIEPRIVVSQPSESWQGATGQITAEQISELATAAPHTLTYLSGPEPMVETLEKSLLGLGMPRDQLVGDFFPGYAAP